MDVPLPPAPSLASYNLSSPPASTAVDEVPEEGLDVPLRLEKMANEVTYKRLKAALTVGAALRPHLHLHCSGCCAMPLCSMLLLQRLGSV